MLTSAITAAITAVLTWLGVAPGPYIAGVWLAVKVLLVTIVTLLGWRAARGRGVAGPLLLGPRLTERACGGTVARNASPVVRSVSQGE